MKNPVCIVFDEADSSTSDAFRVAKIITLLGHLEYNHSERISTKWFRLCCLSIQLIRMYNEIILNFTFI